MTYLEKVRSKNVTLSLSKGHRSVRSKAMSRLRLTPPLNMTIRNVAHPLNPPPMEGVLSKYVTLSLSKGRRIFTC